MNQSILAGLIGTLLAAVPSLAQTAGPWVPDQGDGSYKNPVLFADYSDPDVIRVGKDFYLTASSFSLVPGLPILQSRDLVNWKIVGHAIGQLPARFDTPQGGNGIWAPSIRYHDGWFWIFVGDPDWGILMTRTKDPAGKWEPIHVVQEGKGLIDTCPLWDDDGKAYLVHAFANSRAGRASIIVVNEMSPDGSKLIGEEHLVIDGRNGVHPTIEGPKFYKHDGWYYIMAPAGGVTRGWQIAARSKSPFGPYETKRTLEQGKSDVNGPHQGGWVQTENGQDWFMHFQDRGAYGRIVHLQPMRWSDGWPVMGVDADGNGIGEPVTTYHKPDVGMNYPSEVPQTSDEFNSPGIGLQWQWPANPKPEFASLIARNGWLRLNAVPMPASGLAMAPNVLMQKFPAPKFSATTQIELSPGHQTQAGLAVMGPSNAAIVVMLNGDGLRIRQITNRAPARGATTQPEKIDGSADIAKGPLWLRVSVEPEGICTFSYSTDGKAFTNLGQPFSASGASGSWMGSKIGLFCTGDTGYADFDSFRIN